MAWKDSIYNDQILHNILFNKDFYISNKKYYLANTRYHNIDYFLYFYYRICYYLKEQVAAKKKPIKKEELFNLYYFSLYNIIEKIFKVTKWYFHIFKFVLEYNFTT